MFSFVFKDIFLYLKFKAILVLMNRVAPVDFFRGFFLIIITTNHFLAKQNVIFYFTYEYIGWITAAEGFVFLSGLTAGMVYSRKLGEQGTAFVARAAKRRAWTIYKYHLLLFLVLTLLLFFYPVVTQYWQSMVEEFRLFFQKPVQAIILIISLLYQPAFLDILPMYALFMLLLPFVLNNFKKGKHKRILAGSFLLYLLGTFNLVSLLTSKIKFLELINTGMFNLFSWQLLFVSGLYFGFLTFQNQTARFLQNKKLVFGALLICAGLFLFKQVYYRIGALPFGYDYWVSKDNLGPLRLLNFFSLLVVMGFLATRFPRWFSFKPLCYLGRYSLEVFALHIILVVVFRPLKEYSNNFHALQVSDTLYFYPWATFMLFFWLLPALYLAPVIKNIIKSYRLRMKLAA